MKHTIEGDLVWNKSFGATGFVSVNDFVTSPEGQLILVGGYAAQLTVPPYTLQSANSDCRVKTGYLININKNGQIIRAINDTTVNYIYNIELNDKQQYYTVSEINNGTRNPYAGFEEYHDYPTDKIVLSVRKHDYLHRIIEERDFYINNSESNSKIKLTADEKILLSGSFYSKLDTLPLDVDNQYTNLRLLKFELNNAPNLEPTWEREANLSINIFPNPANGVINIRIVEPNFTNYQLQVIDATGRTVDYFEKEDNFEYVTYSLRNYSAGVYFFKFKNGNETITKKVVVTGN